MLEILEEKEIEKFEQKNRRNLTRRKTVTGIPELDENKSLSLSSKGERRLKIEEKLRSVRA